MSLSNRTVAVSRPGSALLLLFIIAGAATAQSGRTQSTAKPPATGSTSSTMQMQLPTPIAETPVPLVSGGRGELQTLSFTTPDANFERTLVNGAAFSAECVTEQ